MVRGAVAVNVDEAGNAQSGSASHERASPLALREVIKRKDAAFHSAPDYRQTLRDVVVMPDGSGNSYVTFTKDWIANGKTATARSSRGRPFWSRRGLGRG